MPRRPLGPAAAVEGDEEQLLAALLFESAAAPEERPGRRWCGSTARARALLADLVGGRANRRHRPGRGFESLRYRFEIVSTTAPSGTCSATGC